MMRILVLGGSGMLGHKICQLLGDQAELFAAFRSAPPSRYADVFRLTRVIEGVDVNNIDSIVSAVAAARPHAVINCVGIVKQLPEAHDPIKSLTVNALFPHRLAEICRLATARMIHFSTDCVFSGRGGSYVESDQSDAEDLYGRTKFLGEVTAPHALTLRSSIIGRELRTSSGLVEWFLAQAGQSVRGYTKAIFSGFTTNQMAAIVQRILVGFPDLSGLHHVSSDPISKYDLLVLLRDAFRIPLEIVPDESVVIDRSLNSDRFRQLTGFRPPAWPDMVREMADDRTPYEQWRSNGVS
jgi:dTDP-4-dehydrorhamnose reductase